MAQEAGAAAQQRRSRGGDRARGGGWPSLWADACQDRPGRDRPMRLSDDVSPVFRRAPAGAVVLASMRSCTSEGYLSRRAAPSRGRRGRVAPPLREPRTLHRPGALDKPRGPRRRAAGRLEPVGGRPSAPRSGGRRFAALLQAAPGAASEQERLDEGASLGLRIEADPRAVRGMAGRSEGPARQAAARLSLLQLDRMLHGGEAPMAICRRFCP